MTLHVRVDRDICQGNGVCVQRAPEVFDLGDDEIAEVKAESLPDSRYNEVSHAAASCPTQAIEVEKT